MDRTEDMARALAALGHAKRLAIFRLLVRAGDAGLNVGQIGAHLGEAPSTLAHHLGGLVDAGLAIRDRQGREVIVRADYEAMRRTLAFLTEECCTGVALADGAGDAAAEAGAEDDAA